MFWLSTEQKLVRDWQVAGYRIREHFNMGSDRRELEAIKDGQSYLIGFRMYARGADGRVIALLYPKDLEQK